jgi:hypothetical protein
MSAIRRPYPWVRKAEHAAGARAPKPRMHLFRWELDETYDMVEARIRARIASAEASAKDRFVTFTWRRQIAALDHAV